METKWTDDQLEAITHRGGPLLVSAAAGSGKTAVLVERVIRRLTEEEAPTDIDRFLLVTFTNAAAAEMRAKIGEAVSKRLAQQPQNARLRRQLFLLHKSQITTVHSFCLKLLQEHAAQLDIPQDFRIADEKECGVMRQAVLEETLESFYQQEQEGFSQLCEILSAGRDDRKLSSVIQETFDKIQSHVSPVQFLNGLRRQWDGADRPADTAWGKILLEQAQRVLQFAAVSLETAIGQMEGCPEVFEKYQPAFEADRKAAAELKSFLSSGDWDGAVVYLRGLTSFPSLKQVRNFEDKAFLESLKARRTVWKDAVKKLQNDLLCYKEEEIREDRARMAPAALALCDVTQAFQAGYQKEKLRRKLVDFNDLEHFALKLLLKEDGEPSDLARELSGQFDEIMVDEYQDTNAVQDALFHAVSKNGKNLFFVGDVKQSIYRFRLADPSIFLEKYKSFQDIAEAADAPRCVVLSQNFRSRRQVLDAANYIFSSIMSEGLGDIAYGPKEALYLGAEYGKEREELYQTELCILETATEPSEKDDEETPEKAMLEAQYVAGRIFHMLKDGFPVTDKGRQRPAAPSDIVILLRSVSSKAGYFQKALQSFGLASRADKTEGLMETAEISAVCSLLAVIDNPRQDIPLIGALRSPLFGFTEEQLVEIRIQNRQSDFYTALCAAAEAGNEKAGAFLKLLKELRLYAADLPVYQLLWRIYDKTGAMGVYGAMPNGVQRQANLIAFFEHTKAYEAQGYHGLYRFVRLIHQMQEQNKDFMVPEEEQNGGCVRIMSIHKSKGLEFPIVFLADCAKQFNEEDLREPVLLHEKLGIGMKCRDMARGIQYPGVERLAIAAQLRQEMVSEELRVFYVAMTRAKEKLVMTCALKNVPGFVAKCAVLAEMEKLPAHALASARTPAMWLVVPLLRHPAGEALRREAGVSVPIKMDMLPAVHNTADVFQVSVVQGGNLEPAGLEALAGKTDKERQEAFSANPELQYPDAFLSDIPSKITATSITNSFKAEETQENAERPPMEKTLRRPFFDKQKRGLTPSEIGIAHHMFMQFARFADCETKEGRETEIKRLTDSRILSKEQGAALNRRKLERFFSSPLYQKLKKADFVTREFKFSVLVPAGDFYEQASACPDEKLLLQGVIDCLAEEKEGLTIIDFKTDRISPDETEERSLVYAGQLAAYARAVTELFQKPVIGTLLYFFETDQCIAVENKPDLKKKLANLKSL